MPQATPLPQQKTTATTSANADEEASSDSEALNFAELEDTPETLEWLKENNIVSPEFVDTFDAYAKDAVMKGIPSGLAKAASSPIQLGYDVLSWTERAILNQSKIKWDPVFPVDLSIYNELWPEEMRPQTVPGSIADGIIQLAGAWSLDSALYRKFMGLAGITAKTPKQAFFNRLIAQSVINFAATDVDGYNFTNLLEKIPGLDWKIWSFFAAKDTDSHYVKRLKGMIASNLWQWGIRSAWYGGKKTFDALKTVRSKMTVPEKAVARAWDVADYKGAFKLNPRTVNDATAQMTAMLDSQFTRSEPKSNEAMIQAGLTKFEKDVKTGVSPEELIERNLRTAKSAETQYNNSVIGIHKTFETYYTPQFFEATQTAIANPIPENHAKAVEAAARFLWAGQAEIEAHSTPGRSLQLLKHLRFDPDMPSTPTVNPTGQPTDIPQSYRSLANTLFPDDASLFDFYNHLETLRSCNVTGASLAESALELAGAIRKTPNLTPTQRFMQGFDLVVRTYFRNALMSGPGTIWRTFAGNSIGTYIVEPMDTFWTGLVRTGSISRAAGESKAYLQGCAAATMDCWKILASYIQYGNPIMGGLIYDDINPDNVRSLKDTSLVETIAKYPERISGAINETAYFVAYTGELAKQFYNHVQNDPDLLTLYKSKDKADQAALNERWKYFISRGFTDAAIHKQFIQPDGTIKSGILENAAPSLMRDEAIGLDSQAAAKRAREITFIDDIDKTTIPGAFANAIGKGLNKVPIIGGIVQPFYKVNYNIIRSTLVDHGPLGFIKLAKSYKDQLPSEDRARIWGQLLTGGLVYALGWILAKRGLITPGAPKDRTARAAQQNLGIVPHAIKLGDSYWPIANLGPLFNNLLLVTDMVHAIKNLQSQDSSWEKTKVYSGLGAIFKIVDDTTLLQNLASLIKFTETIFESDSKKQDAEFRKMARRGATTFIPAILRGFARRGIDNKVRNTTTFTGQVANSLPFASTSLPEKWDYIVGEPVTFEYNNGLGPKLEEYVKQVTNGRETEDVVLKTLSGMSKTVRPDQARSFGYAVDDQTFSNLEYLTGTLKKSILISDPDDPKNPKIIQGTLYQALDKLIRSDRYKKAEPDYTDERLSKQHEDMINEVIKSYINSAVSRIKSTYQKDQFREFEKKRNAYKRLSWEEKRQTDEPVWDYTNTEPLYEKLLNPE